MTTATARLALIGLVVVAVLAVAGAVLLSALGATVPDFLAQLAVFSVGAVAGAVTTQRPPDPPE